MPDVSAYPLLRTKRRRRRWRVRVDPARVRLAAVLLAALTLLAALLWASRPGPPDPAAALAEARTTLAAGNYNAARSNALRAVTANGRSPAAQLILAEALLELGEGLAAEAALDRAKQAGAPPEQVHHLAARARLLQGDAAGALDRVEIADPRHAGDLARVRAGALASRGQGAAAQAVLEERLARDARDARAWTALGRLRLAADEMGAAADAAATAVRLAPGEPAALTLQGEVVRTRFGLVAALPWFEAALKRDAFYHPALIEYAATLGEAGRHAEALAVTREALKA
jgi:tetratricopeptide (TPR) repeat protein